MREYSILGTTLSFEESSYRYAQYIMLARKAMQNAYSDIMDWYDKCSNLETVLKQYSITSEIITRKYTTHLLYEDLTENGIYDISEEAYAKKCLCLDHSDEAYNKLAQVYNSILKNQEAAVQYREIRKDSRSRVVGGGFGFSGALKGMVTAGAMNAVTGLGHSVVNSVGNAFSALAAGGEKGDIFHNKETPRVLARATAQDVYLGYRFHMDVLNSRIRNFAVSTFDDDKAEALFENAKRYPDKEKELLLQALCKCPWYADIYYYIFSNYPQERKSILTLAEDFWIDLSDRIEGVLAAEYTKAAKTSEKEALLAKAKILATMQELGITESATLDELEKDCIRRIIAHVDTADESSCFTLQKKVKDYDALDKNKKFALERIQARVESIWAAEDGVIFDNLLMNTDIKSKVAVTSAISYIKSKKRTSDADKYLDAFNNMTLQNIRLAQEYVQGKYNRYNIIGWILLLMGALCILFFNGLTLLSIALFVAGLIIKHTFGKRKAMWKKLTLDGTVIHPLLQKNVEMDRKSDNSNTVSNAEQKSGDSNRDMKKCPSCGSMQPVTAIYCGNCGVKLEVPSDE